MRFSLLQLFRPSKALKDGIAERLLGCPHTISMILSYADTATLVACMRVSRGFHQRAGQSLYHTVCVRAGGEAALLCGVEVEPGSNFKRRLLANVRVLTLAGHPSSCRHHCALAHPPHFPNLRTLRLAWLPGPGGADHKCRLLRGAAPSKVVVRNMGELHLPLSVHATQWSAERLQVLVVVLPTHGWLLQSPRRLVHGVDVRRVKVVFWPLWEGPEGPARPAEVMPTTVNPALIIPSLRDLAARTQLAVYGLETLRFGEGSRFAAAVRRACPDVELTQAVLLEHVEAEIAATACEGGGGGGDGAVCAGVEFRTRDEYVADAGGRGGELKAVD
ncbi:hypothetical protein Q8F55_004839 [Vanrija albida]|uniref:F-box domain-containing protein n=1 Tax=Vanrija albida TaxID=181172 RepID=A0ABR3Q0A9_9TREE